nr:hypothetical protein CFP56_78463 [Quercus suber]
MSIASDSVRCWSDRHIYVSGPAGPIPVLTMDVSLSSQDHKVFSQDGEAYHVCVVRLEHESFIAVPDRPRFPPRGAGHSMGVGISTADEAGPVSLNDTDHGEIGAISIVRLGSWRIDHFRTPNRIDFDRVADAVPWRFVFSGMLSFDQW